MSDDDDPVVVAVKAWAERWPVLMELTRDLTTANIDLRDYHLVSWNNNAEHEPGEPYRIHLTVEMIMKKIKP